MYRGSVVRSPSVSVAPGTSSLSFELRGQVSQCGLRQRAELRLGVGHVVHIERERVAAMLYDEAVVEIARQQLDFHPYGGIAKTIDRRNLVAGHGDVDADLAQCVDLRPRRVGQLRDVPLGQCRGAT